MEYIEVDNPTFKGVNSLDDLKKMQGKAPLTKKIRHKKMTYSILDQDAIKKLPLHKHFDSVDQSIYVPDGPPKTITGSETDLLSMPSYNENHLNFKKLVKGIGKGLSNAEKFVVKEVGDVAEATLLLPVLPLKGMMKKAIAKSGAKVPSKFLDIVNSFYQNVVKKHPLAKNPANPAAKGGHYDYPDIDLSSYDQDHQADAIMEIIQAILGFIKDLKKKGLNGALSDVERGIVGDTDQAVNDIKRRGTGMKKKPLNMNIVIGGGAIVLIIILVIIFRKK